MDVNFLFTIVILIMSVVIHEVSHGYAAEFMGDPTPRLQGRLTLNPLKHLDWFGSVFLPAMSYFFGGIIFGWAKPVMINSYNFRWRKWGEPFVALAGPVSNILIAVFFGQIIHFASALNLSQSFVQISSTIVVMNLVLAVFNLVPIPPLDGSRVLFALLPQSAWKGRPWLEHYGIFIVIILVSVVGGVIDPIVNFLFSIIT